MLERGYSLANVAELIGTWEGGHDISKLLGLEAALTSPWTSEPPATLPMAQYLEMFGDALTPAALAKAVDTGIIRIEGETVHVSSIKLVQAGALLAKEGVPLDELLQIVAELRAESERIAGDLMALTTNYVFDRYGEDALPPPEEVPRLAELIWQLRPMVMQIVDAEVAHAMERAADKIWARNFPRLSSRCGPRFNGGQHAGGDDGKCCRSQNETDARPGIRRCGALARHWRKYHGELALHRGRRDPRIHPLLEETRRQALDRMVRNANLMGANAVVMMRFDSSEIGQSMSEIVAYGTAVIVEPEG